jgi:hypothetical protein
LGEVLVLSPASPAPNPISKPILEFSTSLMPAALRPEEVFRAGGFRQGIASTIARST